MLLIYQSLQNACLIVQVVYFIQAYCNFVTSTLNPICKIMYLFNIPEYGILMFCFVHENGDDDVMMPM